MEFIRVNKISKAQEKEMENVNGAMDHIMMEIGKMGSETVLECSSRDKESNIKENGRMIRSMGEELLSLKMEMLSLDFGKMID